jgi:rsbT co-antagonist protein RsbR
MSISTASSGVAGEGPDRTSRRAAIDQRFGLAAILRGRDRGTDDEDDSSEPEWEIDVGQNGKDHLACTLAEDQARLASEWAGEQSSIGARRAGSARDGELRDQCCEFLRLLGDVARSAEFDDIRKPAWRDLRELLDGISRGRSHQGYSPSETATFVFSLKGPLFNRLRHRLADDGEALAEAILTASDLLDRLGLYTTEVHQNSREEVILRQQEEMLELTTPVVKLWDGILALPMIGTLDSARTQVVMETLLQKIVESGSCVAIIDITGVPTVDTLTAQHLLKTVTASRLMGADCIISGIRPQIAQTIVHLGVDLGAVITKATMADAFALALSRTGQTVVKLPARS